MTISRETELYILTMFNEVKIKNDCTMIESDVCDVLCNTTDTVFSMLRDAITDDIETGKLDDLEAVLSEVIQKHGKTFDDNRCYNYLYDAVYDTLFR